MSRTMTDDVKLTETMWAALLAAPAHDQELERTPYSVREGTRIALETRGLVEFDERRVWLDNVGRESAGRYWHWRRTQKGDKLADELDLDDQWRPIGPLEHRSVANRID